MFAFIAAGGSVGAIAGPLVIRLAVRALGLDGMLLIAAVGFMVVIVLVHLLMREKERLRRLGEGGQPTTLDHDLAGGALDGFRELLRSAYSRHQAAFILLMTWVNTVAYFLQTDVISQAFSAVAARAVAIADISLVVNILAAIILLFGLGRYVHRFGVTAGLILNPIIMVVAFIALALSPTLLMIQALQVIRQVSQYAIARPSREICFTVVPQADRYKTKNVIDTVVYRFGDLSAAWMRDRPARRGPAGRGLGRRRIRHFHNLGRGRAAAGETLRGAAGAAGHGPAGHAAGTGVVPGEAAAGRLQSGTAVGL